MPFYHYKSNEDVEVYNFLQIKTQLSLSDLKDLVQLGCLYLNQNRWLPQPGETLRANQIIRFHPTPKRFSSKQMKKLRVISDTIDYIAIYKPPGIPSHETLDNRIENAKTATQELVKEPLISLARLDVGTQGILLFAKTKDFAKKYNSYLQSKKILKFYSAISEGMRSLELGQHQHWMYKSKRSPKMILDQEEYQNLNKGDFLACILMINESVLFKGSIENSYRLNDLFRTEPMIEHNRRSKLYLNQIQLITGRTHQIRSQLSKMDHPIVGDRTYKSLRIPNHQFETFALACTHVICQDLGLDIQIKTADIQW